MSAAPGDDAGGGGRIPSEVPDGTLWFVGGLLVLLPVLALTIAVISSAVTDLGAVATINGWIAGLTAALGGGLSGVTSTIDWATTTLPAGSTPVPVFDFEVPNAILMVVGMIAGGFVVVDRLTASRIPTGGLPVVADVADLSRAGLVVFFAWLVYVRADSLIELVWWLAAAIPFILIGIVFYSYFQVSRETAKSTTASRNTPDAVAERVGDWGEITLNGVVAFLVGVLAFVQVITQSVGALGESLLSISAEVVYSIVVWLGYQSLGGSFGADLLPSFSAEQYVFAAAVLGVLALTLRRTGSDSGS